ncbi:hypothetical protein EG329_013706 [Mollisiaceae sp. DMI_Dod_QoI]|nr:hypothetical protein EG329_013706 [Helotiales sp. DMI_Dod_QoI]
MPCTPITANVMTRDPHRVHDDRSPASDAEVYAALWAAAPFPRVPDDAPNELKKVAIDIEDPRRVYAIHRAARRHQSQILVERYIHQIRYGCQSTTCHTSTCFSCRKRLAGGAPVRRYNATSARTLAVYLASQDNPEQGLCHHKSAERPAALSDKPPKLKPVSENGTRESSPLPSLTRRTSGRDARIHVSVGSSNTPEDNTGSEKTRRSNSIEDIFARRLESDLSAVEDTTTVDHRSFIQNVFGTVAFKMVEWLTPRNLELLARSQEKPASSPKTVPNLPSSSPLVEGKPLTGHKIQERKHDSSLKKNAEDKITASEPEAGDHPVTLETQPKTPVLPKSAPKSSQEPKPCLVESKPTTETATRSPLDSNRHRRSYEMPGSRGILNKTSKLSETVPDVTPFPPQGFIPTPKQRLSRQSLITSPKMQITELPPVHEIKPLPVGSVTEPSDSTEQTQDEATIEPKPEEASKVPVTGPKETSCPKAAIREISLPQSLSSMSIEMVEFLCDIFQWEGIFEQHLFYPQDIPERSRNTHTSLKRQHRLGLKTIQESTQTKKQWKLFVEQAFFDVLSKPDSLIQSFSDDKSTLFDTQSIWYLMLRMTRVAPSLVLDSLWNAAGTLFRPPEKLEEAYDWMKDTELQKSPTQQSVSNHDAAQVINICLHALVAIAPLVTDPRQLANLSRVRSYGLAMLGRESAFLEPLALCLQYEDAFTNELAVRLARRIFSVIPIRRRFTELLELQKDIRIEANHDPDMLETVLGSLKYFDSGTPSTINFTDQERDMHEKRVPTLLLDWARTIMLQDWQGSADVPSDGPFGGALAMMAAIYKNRKSLLLGDIHFRTEYFAERLDPVEMPLEWLNFTQNKRTVHLLDYPYLFNPSTLVTYFRAINYSRMNQFYEQAKATNGLMYSTAAENNLMVDKNRRDRLYERLRTATSRFMVLEIRRTNVLVDTFNSIWRREERELMRPLKIRLGEEGGEEGLDSGGVQQEFFRLAIAEALDPDYGTFTIDNRTKMTWFLPGSPEPLWKFELIGMIISLAVYNGLTLPVTFPKALYRKLLDEDVTELHHIADGWPDLANGLTQLLEWDEKDGLVEDIFARTYEFSVEQFGEPVSREMGKTDHWPQFSEPTTSNPTDAPLVTHQNRNSYVSDYIRWLTDISVQPQFDAFKRGFFTCVDRRSITLFDPETLQSIVEGIQEIDISEMRRATRYIGWDASHHSVRDFWSIVKRYDLEQKRKLLEFVTASDRVPVGGMRNLQFTLQRNGVDDGHLPSSYTCYGILLLPEYSSKEVLREKLAMALENSKGFGFA